MFNITSETVLTEYFTYDCIAGALINNDKLLFDRLCEVFMLPKNEREALYALTKSSAVKAVTGKKDYMQYLRVKKYAELVGICDETTEDENRAVVIKGCAVSAAAELGLCPDGEATESLIYRSISECANGGALIALRLLGFLQCEGLFVKKDRKAGIVNLNKAARWNCAQGALMSLYYDKASREEMINRLFTFARDTVYDGALFAAEKKYGVKASRVMTENKLLNKAFGAGTLKPDTYMAQYARIIFSRVISSQDKERLLFAASKELLCETVDLPLKLSFKAIDFDAKALSKMPIRREAEVERVTVAMENVDMRASSVYQPLCLCTDSDYVMNAYLSAIKSAFVGCRVEKLEVSDMCEYDFEPTRNNVFVRSCDEDSSNVYLLVFKGEISDRAAEFVAGFLQSDKRAKIRLVRPGALLDLSAVLPICFCDKENEKKLKKYCDTVELEAVSTAEEKRAAIADLLETKRTLYNVREIEMGEKTLDLLVGSDIDTAEGVLDKAIRLNRRKGQTLVLTEEMLKKYMSEGKNRKIRYGFGGEIQ